MNKNINESYKINEQKAVAKLRLAWHLFWADWGFSYLRANFFGLCSKFCPFVGQSDWKQHRIGQKHDFESRERSFAFRLINNHKLHMTSNDARWIFCLGRGKACEENNGDWRFQLVVNNEHVRTRTITSKVAKTNSIDRIIIFWV